MFYTARRSGLRGRKLVYIAATAMYAAPTRVFGIFCAVLAQPYANLRTLYARPTYTYACYTQSYAWVRQFSYPISTPCLCIRYATIRNRTPTYADPATFSWERSRSTPEYADNFGVEGTRDNATVRGPGVKGALGYGVSWNNSSPNSNTISLT